MAKVKFHFFGKDCFLDNSLRDTADVCQKIKYVGFDFNYHPHFINQIHGSQVLVIDSVSKIFDEKNPLPKVDALVTNIKKLPICVITADCVPIVFFDEIAEVIGIAHSGWKGAKAGIIENTLEKMLKLGAKIEQIKVIIGPCIRQKFYEVSKEFFDDFIKMDEKNAAFFVAGNGENGARSGHFLFDLAAYCIFRLKNSGIINISDQGIDTYSNEETFFSYRRSTHRKEADCGRNVSVVMID